MSVSRVKFDVNLGLKREDLVDPDLLIEPLSDRSFVSELGDRVKSLDGVPPGLPKLASLHSTPEPMQNTGAKPKLKLSDEDQDAPALTKLLEPVKIKPVFSVQSAADIRVSKHPNVAVQLERQKDLLGGLPDISKLSLKDRTSHKFFPCDILTHPEVSIEPSDECANVFNQPDDAEDGMPPDSDDNDSLSSSIQPPIFDPLPTLRDQFNDALSVGDLVHTSSSVPIEAARNKEGTVVEIIGDKALVVANHKAFQIPGRLLTKVQNRKSSNKVLCPIPEIQPIPPSDQTTSQQHHQPIGETSHVIIDSKFSEVGPLHAPLTHIDTSQCLSIGSLSISGDHDTSMTPEPVSEDLVDVMLLRNMLIDGSGLPLPRELLGDFTTIYANTGDLVPPGLPDLQPRPYFPAAQRKTSFTLKHSLESSVKKTVKHDIGTSPLIQASADDCIKINLKTPNRDQPQDHPQSEHEDSDKESDRKINRYAKTSLLARKVPIPRFEPSYDDLRVDLGARKNQTYYLRADLPPGASQRAVQSRLVVLGTTLKWLPLKNLTLKRPSNSRRGLVFEAVNVPVGFDSRHSDQIPPESKPIVVRLLAGSVAELRLPVQRTLYTLQRMEGAVDGGHLEHDMGYMGKVLGYDLIQSSELDQEGALSRFLPSSLQATGAPLALCVYSEKLKGEPLTEVFNRLYCQLPYYEKERFLKPHIIRILSSLKQLHSRGVFHGAIVPPNILTDPKFETTLLREASLGVLSRLGSFAPGFTWSSSCASVGALYPERLNHPSPKKTGKRSSQAEVDLASPPAPVSKKLPNKQIEDIVNGVHRQRVGGSVFGTGFGVDRFLMERAGKKLLYAAPESLSSDRETQNASPEDIWQLGLLIIEAMSHEHPKWRSALNDGLGLATEIAISPELPQFPLMTPSLTHFVNSCLVKNPRDRPTAETLLKHPWISS